MKQFPFKYYSGPLIALGLLVAIACLACSWYINRLEQDLARAVKKDVASMEAALNLQVQLRHLRVHALVFVSDRTDARRQIVQSDLDHISEALAAVQNTASTADDTALAQRIIDDYAEYLRNLGFDRLPPSGGTMSDLAKWSDSHHMADLLVPCKELADRQRERMQDSLERSESQTAWAGRVLLGLGLVGVLAGLVSGFVSARALTRRVARLSVRVQAVQAHLDQDVGDLTVQEPPQFDNLDVQLDRIVSRVSDVCKRLQEQERDLLRAEQLAVVGQLAASVAHEIRNPLTGVKLLLQAAVRPEAPTSLTSDRLQLLLQEVGRIERTVQGLMDFAVASRSDRRATDLRAIVESAVEVARIRANTKSIEIRVESPPSPVIASVDSDRFLSLFTNLLINAIDATPNLGRVDVSMSSGPEHTIRMVVADTGPGLDNNLGERLFSPFVTTKPAGTGLGLAIAQRVAREHGGTLTAADRPGGGACFTLILPAGEHPHADVADR